MSEILSLPRVAFGKWALDVDFDMVGELGAAFEITVGKPSSGAHAATREKKILPDDDGADHVEGPSILVGPVGPDFTIDTEDRYPGDSFVKRPSESRGIGRGTDTMKMCIKTGADAVVV
jgi:hypothetical protein